ncbi:MAG: M15 family metallopeptidase [Candidatus Paceibacterota bacterium]|jgi:D-alanyl-D-alanine carboxypeptidase
MLGFLKSRPNALPLLTLALVCAFGGLAYGGYRYALLQQSRYEDIKSELRAQTLSAASTTSALISSIETLEKSLNLSRDESMALAIRLTEERDKVESLQKTTEKIGGTVGTLEKLSRVDPELLKKYSKVFFLNENYVPAKLSEIKNEYLYNEKKTEHILSDVLPRVTRMIDEAKQDGVTIYVKSAYRSFNEQNALKTGYKVLYGEGANAFSADQGYSEHQLGTTIDFITTGVEGQLTEAFDKTAAYEWLSANAHLYGFALSYPKNNKYYTYEPWHWRFVGTLLAKKLRDKNMNFYDMEQRTIDGYLVSLFD